MTITNEDNMIMMARYPDKYFDLAIVDPPYGIGWDGGNDITKKGRPDKFNRQENPKYSIKEWDSEKPSNKYWEELFRVSKNQIVWGGNYFSDYLPPKKCWIFWDKLYDKTFNFSHGELAWTSLNTRMLKVVMSSKTETCGGQNKIHPCQKPVKLYKWLLDQFAKPIDCECFATGHPVLDNPVVCIKCNNTGKVKPKILDTHLGSGSIAIACHDYGFDLTACELDTEYFLLAKKRIQDHQNQLKIAL